jgi:hypothetical protein
MNSELNSFNRSPNVVSRCPGLHPNAGIPGKSRKLSPIHQQSSQRFGKCWYVTATKDVTS